MTSKEIYELIRDFEFSLDRKSTLLILLVIVSSAYWSYGVPYLKDSQIDVIWHLSIYLILMVLIIFIWYIKRNVFPKPKSKKEQIVLAIITENSKQKSRISDDLSEEIKKLLKRFNLNQNFDLVSLNNSLSTKLQTAIEDDLHSRRLINEPFRNEKLKNALSKMKAKFIVYGNLKERNAPKTAYYFNLNAFIIHNVTSISNTQSIINSFRTIWKQEIIFLEENEINELKENASYLFFVAAYMIGLATFIDNKYLEGVNIWTSLSEYVRENKELDFYQEQIAHLKAMSHFLCSRMLYLKGDYDKSSQHRRAYLSEYPNEYDKHLNEAIRQVSLLNDPELALDHIHKAKDIAPENEGTWRYSELYLLIKLEKYIDALAVLNDIENIQYNTEFDAINQVINYNDKQLNADFSHIQSHFIIGFLMLKKVFNYPLAYENLTLFIKKSQELKKYSGLLEHAKIMLDEVCKKLKIKN